MVFKKNIVFIFLFVCVGFWYLPAQKPFNASFFDKNGKLSTLEDAFYFRASTDTVDYYRSYYAIDSSLYFQGKIISAKDSSDQKNKYSGICTWYYTNGNKKTEYNYNDNGFLNGICTDYFENGKLKKQVEYENNRVKNKTYPEYGANGSSATVFYDDFIDNRFNWLVSENDSGSAKIRIGGLELINKNSKGYSRLFPHKINSKNFSVEAFINSNYLSEVSRTGFVFGYMNMLNYSYFYVSKTHYYIGKIIDGKETMQANGFSYTPLRESFWNKIKIIYKNNKLFYSINDEVFDYSDESKPVENVGLGLKTQSAIMFDKFILKEYLTDGIIEDILPVNKTEEKCALYNEDYQIKSFFTGFFLRKDGLILTGASNFGNYDKIIVEAYVNDSIKKFSADVIIKDGIHNLTILKIKNPQNYSFTEPAYDFYDLPKPEIESELYSIYFTKDDSTKNKPVIVSGNLTTSLENISGTFFCSLKTGDISFGAPVFSKNGTLLGVISVPATKNLTTVIKTRFIEQLAFYSNQDYKKTKRPENLPKGDIEAISKNIVLIKVR